MVSQEITVAEALELLRAQAFTVEADWVFEPVDGLIDGEQLYREVTPPGRVVVHALRGSFGADWSLEAACAAVEAAGGAFWADPGSMAAALGHHLIVAAPTGAVAFAVSPPAP